MYCYPVLNDYVEQNLFQEALDDIFAKDSLSNSDIYNLAICYSNLGDFEKAQKNLMDFIKKVEYNLTPAIFLDYRISALRESNYWENVYQLLIEKFLYESGPITDTALAIKIMEHGILDQKYRGLIITQPCELAPTKQKRKVNERRKEFGFTTTVEEEIEKHNKNKVTFYK